MASSARELKAMKIRRNIRAAQLRVALDKERGRETPEAVVRLSKLPLPELPAAAPKKPLRQRHMAAS